MRKSKTKKMILNAILLGLGMLLNQLAPAIAVGITPDVTLVMLCCIILINLDDYKTCLIAGIIAGVFTALTTKFPGGQAPNMIDKLVTINVIYFLAKTMYMLPIAKKLGKKMNMIAVILMSAIGTVVSGFVFLYSASLIVGLPGGIVQLFVVVVLPTVVINIITAFIVYNIIALSLRRSSMQIG